MTTYPKSVLGRTYVRKADLLRDLDPVLSALDTVKDKVDTIDPDAKVIEVNGSQVTEFSFSEGVTANVVAGVASVTTNLPSATSTVAGLTITTAQQAQWDAAALITEWHLDRVLGNDTNDGSAAHPLRTGTELSRRLGPWAAWSQSVTITIGVNGLDDALVVKGDTVLAGVHVDIVGTPTQVADAGTISSFTAAEHTTPRATQITCAGISDWSPYVGMRLRVTTGSNVGSVCWVLKANPHGLGLNVARISVPYRKTDIALASGQYAKVVLTVGDTITIESLPVIPAVECRLGGAYAPIGGNGWPNRQSCIQAIATKSLTVERSGEKDSNRCFTFGCRLMAVNNPNAKFNTANAKGDLVASLFTTDDIAYYCIVTGPLMGSCTLGTRGITPVVGTVTYLGDFTFQAGLLYGLNGIVSGNSVQIFDVAAANSNIITASFYRMVFYNLSGSDNVGRAVIMNPGTQIQLYGSINLSASDANLYMAAYDGSAVCSYTGALSTVRTCADLQWSGTATLVAGVADITVPFVDWLKQRVTITPTAIAGTPGTVTVPVASRTSTGFRLTSTNVSDISTFEWSLTPAGRNVRIYSN